MRLQPSEIMQMPYYEFEYILENLIDILEKKKEAEEGNDEASKEKQSEMMGKARSMMPSGMPSSSSSSTSMPSMPSFPSVPSSLKI